MLRSWLRLQKGKTPPFNECPVYDIKLYDGEALVLELWEMWSYPFIAIASRSTLIRSGITW